MSVLFWVAFVISVTGTITLLVGSEVLEVIYNPIAIFSARYLKEATDNHVKIHVQMRNSNNKCRLAFRIYIQRENYNTAFQQNVLSNRKILHESKLSVFLFKSIIYQEVSS